MVVITAALAHKALMARPGLNQRAVHAEVLAREPAVDGFGKAPVSGGRRAPKGKH